MKITRRFLALVLCLALFIIPLPFSVHAHENSSDTIMLLSDYSEPVNCPRCDGLYVVSLTGTTYTKKISTYDRCIGSYYTGVRMECVDCHYQETKYDVLYAVSQHPTLIYGTDEINGIPVTGWHCPACDYCRRD